MKLIIIGAGGHGRVVADIAKLNGYSDITFLDNNTDIQLCGNYRVIGEPKEATKYKDCDFFVAIGNSVVRRNFQMWLNKEKLKVVTLIHPNAVVADTVEVGQGSVVMAGAVLNPYTKIGQGCIINTCVSVDHDCIIGDYVHIAVGSHIAGTVKIGDSTWIGAGVTVINNINITGNCMIGAGAVVVDNLTDEATYIGVPARRKK